jgi:hypothetical protein
MKSRFLLAAIALLNLTRVLHYRVVRALAVAAILTGATVAGEQAYGSTLQFGNAYYTFVSANAISWADAEAAAEASTFMGVTGHLATITTAAENNFLATNFPTFDGLALAWIGGQVVGTSGVGAWVVGPLAGLAFSSRIKRPLTSKDFTCMWPSASAWKRHVDR